LSSPVWFRHCVALFLTALATSGCPALLDDDFTTFPADNPDAGGQVGTGGAASAGGTLGSAGTFANGGIGGTGAIGADASGGIGGAAGSGGVGGAAGSGGGPTNWTPMAAPPPGFAGRSRAAATWTGTQVFIWGGQSQSTALNTGALYDPLTNAWTSVAVDASTPSARVLATAIWTGSVVVVWGGGDMTGNQDYADGGRWNPTTNSWQPITTNGAPSPRRASIGQFVGSRVLFWGGFQKSGTPEGNAYLYDPVADAWTQTPAVNQPPKLLDAATGWSGTDFYVYGGQPDGTGSSYEAWAYDPSLNEWRVLPPGPTSRSGALGAWDGSHFVAWGGIRSNAQLMNDGRRYDPTAGGRGTWINTTLSGAPSARRASARQAGWAARTSRGLLILGGLGASPTDVQRDGAIYDSTTNTFAPVPAWPSGEQRLWASAVWTGSEFVLWGGLHNGQPTATGERLQP
jgi:hypothetical protein